MKVFVFIFLPIIISSKNYLIETKDSAETDGDEVKDFFAGTDYDMKHDAPARMMDMIGKNEDPNFKILKF